MVSRANAAGRQTTREVGAESFSAAVSGRNLAEGLSHRKA